MSSGIGPKQLTKVQLLSVLERLDFALNDFKSFVMDENGVAQPIDHSFDVEFKKNPKGKLVIQHISYGNRTSTTPEMYHFKEVLVALAVMKREDLRKKLDINREQLGRWFSWWFLADATEYDVQRNVSLVKLQKSTS